MDEYHADKGGTWIFIRGILYSCQMIHFSSVYIHDFQFFHSAAVQTEAEYGGGIAEYVYCADKGKYLVINCMIVYEIHAL